MITETSQHSALLSWQLRKEAKQMALEERKRQILKELQLEEIALKEDSIFMLMDCRYKIGPHGFVFREVTFNDWVKSEMTSEELLSLVGSQHEL